MAYNRTYTGTLKSFSTKSNYGFIECADLQAVLGKDVFVMRTSFPGGVQPSRGTQLTFSLTEGSKGPQAENVQVVGGGSNFKSGGKLGIGGQFRGIIKSFVPSKNWGMISCDDTMLLYGKDMFFLRTSVKGNPQAGAPCTFVIGSGQRGPEATEVQLMGGFGGSQANAFGGGLALAMPAAQHMGGPVMGWQNKILGTKEGVFFGNIKFFDEGKGYGMISCDATRKLLFKDVFFMKTSLSNSGASAGDLVSFEVGQGMKGPEATAVNVLPPGSFSTDKQAGNTYSGTVKSFNADRGWGFIESDEIKATFQKDIYMHKKEFGGIVPNAGDPVQFTIQISEHGRPEATNIRGGGYVAQRPTGKGHVQRASPY